MSGVGAAAIGDVRTVWASVALTTPAEVTDALLDAIPPVINGWGDVAATVAADWYDETRDTSGAEGRYRARLTQPLPDAQIEATIRWAVTPIWTALDWDRALRDLTYGSERLAQLPGSQTIVDNAFADPAARRYVRVPRITACPWCLMLAGRGAVYRSQQTADFAAHDNCGCVASPAWSDDDIPDFNRALGREWQQVTRGLSGDDALRAWADHIALSRT